MDILSIHDFAAFHASIWKILVPIVDILRSYITIIKYQEPNFTVPHRKVLSNGEAIVMKSRISPFARKQILSLIKNRSKYIFSKNASPGSGDSILSALRQRCPAAMLLFLSQFFSFSSPLEPTMLPHRPKKSK